MTDTQKNSPLEVADSDLELLQKKYDLLLSEREADEASIQEQANLIQELFNERDKSIENFLAEIKHQKELVALANEALIEAKSIIDDLKAKLTGAKETRPIVKIGKLAYLVTAAMITKTGVLSPAEIAADLDLCQTLISKKSTILIRK